MGIKPSILARPVRPGAAGSLASEHLDLLRGAAAVAVLIYHVRYRFFFDYADLANLSLLQKGFYALTAFGHDAVIVFFVLSGYFISSSIIRDCASGNWSWRKYLTNRFVRLYVVLLPGLALTALWDRLGLHYFWTNPIYTGQVQGWQHDFFPVENRLGWPTLLGNLCFLQNVRVPPYGSNDPLWSLSYEFWYYLLFPCAWLGLFGRSVAWWKRLAYIAACGCGLFALGRGIAIYFPIWLMGTAVALLPRAPWLASKARSAGMLGGALFLTSLGVTHMGAFRQALGYSVVACDFVTASSFAGLLYLILQNRTASAQGVYSRIAKELAGMSYTLYVVHMSVLVFLRAVLLPGAPWFPDAFHMAAAALLGLMVLAYAAAVARLTEKHTDAVRALVWQRLRPQMPQPGTPSGVDSNVPPASVESASARPG
jgi:peptidoglycan/LPS O-acetylase OafA/YrhL